MPDSSHSDSNLCLQLDIISSPSLHLIIDPYLTTGFLSHVLFTSSPCLCYNLSYPLSLKPEKYDRSCKAQLKSDHLQEAFPIPSGRMHHFHISIPYNLLYIIIKQCSLFIRRLIMTLALPLNQGCFIGRNIFKHVVLAYLHCVEHKHYLSLSSE